MFEATTKGIIMQSIEGILKLKVHEKVNGVLLLRTHHLL